MMEHMEGALLRHARCLTCKQCVWLERLARDKHSSLLRKFLNYGRKKFYNLALGPSVTKLFMAVIYEFLQPPFLAKSNVCSK
jgi:hypothetical protein